MREDVFPTADPSEQAETEAATTRPRRRTVIKGAIAGAAALLPALSLTTQPAAAQSCAISVSPSPLDDLDRRVRITIPAGIASDLKALQVGLATIAERLGCRGCFSGADCTFWTERNLAINPGNVESARLPSVTVSLSKEIGNNLASVQDAIGRVVGKLGCPACCSGFDILFRQEVNFMEIR